MDIFADLLSSFININIYKKNNYIIISLLLYKSVILYLYIIYIILY